MTSQLTILKEQDKVVLMEGVIDMYQNKKSSMKKSSLQFTIHLVTIVVRQCQTLMDPYLYSCCGNGIVVLKVSNSEDNKGRMYYQCPLAKPPNFGCEYFVWEDELFQCQCGQGLCHASKNKKGVTYRCPINGEKNCGFRQFMGTAVLKARSSPANKWEVSNARIAVPKKAEASCSSPGSSRGLEAKCPNCKHLTMKIKLLEAKLENLARGLDNCKLDQLLAEFDGLLLNDGCMA
ncbi:DNA topoisomerase, type IA [Tanacetum coccineum]